MGIRKLHYEKKAKETRGRGLIGGFQMSNLSPT